MSLLFSSTGGHELSVPVCPLDYRDVVDDEEMSGHASATLMQPMKEEGELRVDLSPSELEELLSGTRAEAAADVERRLRADFEAKAKADAEHIRDALEAFTCQRKLYFANVEGEVIRLALAIAAKILHRESQADPMLVSAMVRIALEQMRDGSVVTVRVPEDEVEAWRRSLAGLTNEVAAEIVGDAQLSSRECVLQAELGTVDFSIDAQLKEVEQGFFDLLAKRPELR